MFRGKYHNTKIIEDNIMYNGTDEPDGCFFTLLLPVFVAGIFSLISSLFKLNIFGVVIGIIALIIAVFFMFYRTGKFIDKNKKTLTVWYKLFKYEKEIKYHIGVEKFIYIESQKRRRKYGGYFLIYCIKFANCKVIWDEISNEEEALKEAKKVAEFLGFSIQ